MFHDAAQNHGYLTQERPRYLTSYPPAGMRLTAEHVHNGTIRHGLQGNNPTLSGVNSAAGRFLYSGKKTLVSNEILGKMVTTVN